MNAELKKQLLSARNVAIEEIGHLNETIKHINTILGYEGLQQREVCHVSF